MAKRKKRLTKGEVSANEKEETQKFWKVVGISTVILIVLIYLLFIR